MNKEQLKYDMNFRYVCSNFKTNFWDYNFEIYGNVIKLNSNNKGIYTLIDEHYNVIGVYTDELSLEHQTKEELANKIAKIYKNYSEVNETNILPAPFEGLSLKEIQDLSNRIEIMSDGHFTDMTINLQDVCKTDDDFSKLCFYYLTYIKFLGCYINKYFKESFHMKSLGASYPDVYTYLSKIINGIEEYIINSIGAIRYIGNYIDEVAGAYIEDKRDDFWDKYSNIIYQIVNFYEFDYSKVNNIKLDSNMFSSILEVPDEVIEERKENLKKYISPGYVKLLDIIKPKNSYSLTKRINNKRDLS